ncbi:hypothetical protein C7M84_025178 [Penaeus vannamei]|uniref:Uncharacterized protein n=1 Tax=Penaeus vannamei TaxID=6689 RepID=A0A423TYY0_PENVA|nr:hypothetical protein C7M84_025178 [Penaeus vannamei]
MERLLLRGEDSPGRESNKCCRRERKMKTVGLSVATGEEITVDIGQCKKHCTKSKLKKDEFEQLIEENPDIDPRTLFEMHRRRRAEPSCLGDEVCAPSDARMERILTLEGSVSVSVTDECACQPRSHSCRRKPHRVTLHKDTPLQTTVDVGDCHGHCAHDLGCKPIKTRTVTVEGPNGPGPYSSCNDILSDAHCPKPLKRRLSLGDISAASEAGKHITKINPKMTFKLPQFLEAVPSHSADDGLPSPTSGTIERPKTVAK